MKLTSVMQGSHSFSQVPQAVIPRSKFDRSFGHKTLFSAGYLVPMVADEALPGDTFKYSMTAFARLVTPLQFPIMDNLYLDVQYFAIPLRLIWSNFEKFMGAQNNPGDSIDYLIPQATETATVGSLSDYFGIPTGVSLTRSNLFHRAYNLVYNTWYRDENLQNSITVDMGDGPDTPANYVLKKRGKRHDYFTSCLPWPQKGTAVSIGLTGNATVKAVDTDILVHSTGSSTDRALRGRNDALVDTTTAFGGIQNLRWGATTGLVADMSTVTSTNINALRQAFQLQKLLERDARGGTRYVELLKSHFGVTSPDFRLQRPEYLGGGSFPILVHQVAKTSSTDATSAQANVSAFATCAITNCGFSKSFVEHSIVLGIVSVRADLTYQQGLDRKFSRKTRYDFYWPEFSHIGEQAVLNKEIYAQGTADDELVFGYQERHAEYRYGRSMITGLFRSTASGTLDAWHLSQKFDALPVLNASFIEENPPLARVSAVPSQPTIIFDSFFKVTAVRPMPMFGVPGLIDHF